MIKEKPPDQMKCIKVPLNYVLKHKDINKNKISDAVVRANNIVINTLMFMKLYILTCIKDKKNIPKIDKVFVNTAMKTVCKEHSIGRPASDSVKGLKGIMKTCYDSEYSPLLVSKDFDYKHLNTVLDYLTVDIVTMYENNIKQHFVEYIERFVNVKWKKKYLIKKIRSSKMTKAKKIEKINKLCSHLRKIKNDLLDISGKYKSDKSYHTWITKEKKNIIPGTEINKKGIYYDLKCNPQPYFLPMIYITQEIEKEGKTTKNVFPLRTELIPKHIRIDTTTLVHLLLRKEHGTKSSFLTKGNLKRCEDQIWKFFFRTERKCFHKKNYTFNKMIETDGISCSILLVRKDLEGRKFKPKVKVNKEKYIDELADYSSLKAKKIVAIDPNKSDLLYCVDGEGKDRNFFRYTQNQRKKETKQKKYSKILEELKTKKIYGKTVIEWETLLSKLNRKSLDLKEFKKYIKEKDKMNKKLFPFYEQELFRKLKLHGYTNRLKSEQKMLSRFSKIFGKPENTVIAIGDFDQKKHMKFKEPVKGLGFRKLFRKNGYGVYLVDEFKTSCRCHNCTNVCEKFRVINNPRPWRDDTLLCHGLLKCKTCNKLWNRDENSSINIYKLAKTAIEQKERPVYLSRSKYVSVGSNLKGSRKDEVCMSPPHNQNLHGLRRSNLGKIKWT